jgi:DNA-binding transcriptional LysR family regulator
VRADHPTIGGELTRKQFIEGRHAVVHPAGHMNDSLEVELQQQGLTRHISVRLEHFLAIPTLLERSDLIFTVPYAIGASLARLAAIKLVKPPFKARPRVVRQHWHSRFQKDAANRWIRGVVADLFMDKRPRTRRGRS